MSTPTIGGRPTCKCFAAWFPVFEAECIARGYRSRPFRIFQLIGNAKQSAGYHASGAVADLELLSEAEQVLSREMGAGGWNRYGWQGFDDEHHHLALYGCPHLTDGVEWQLTDLARGNNGLSGRSHGKDYGSGPRAARTWQEGLEWLRNSGTASAEAANPEEEDVMHVIARTTDDPQVWIGDGITRRMIVSQDTLKNVQYLASVGALRVFQNGAVQQVDDLWALGHPIDLDLALVKDTVAAGTRRSVAETSSAFHQQQDVLRQIEAKL